MSPLLLAPDPLGINERNDLWSWRDPGIGWPPLFFGLINYLIDLPRFIRVPTGRVIVCPPGERERESSPLDILEGALIGAIGAF